VGGEYRGEPQVYEGRFKGDHGYLGYGETLSSWVSKLRLMETMVQELEVSASSRDTLAVPVSEQWYIGSTCVRHKTWGAVTRLKRASL
jgi:hypothetical protein